MAGKDKVPALVYNVPGAARAWHWVQWTGPGSRFHPDIPVPHENAEKFVKAHQERAAEAKREWDKFEAEMEAGGHRQHGRIPWTDPPLPLKVVYVSASEAEQGLDALNEALGQADDGGEG